MDRAAAVAGRTAAEEIGARVRAWAYLNLIEPVLSTNVGKIILRSDLSILFTTLPHPSIQGAPTVRAHHGLEGMPKILAFLQFDTLLI